MSGSDRGDRSQNLGGWGIVVAILLSCLIVGGLSYQSGIQSERRDKTPASYAKAAKENAKRSCVGMDGTATFECIYEKVESSQEQARGEQDLTAQQQSAFAAITNLFFVFLTLGVTGVGVWYVRETLRATLKAVEDTGEATREMKRSNDIAEKAQRPWVTLDLKPELVSPSADGIYFRLNVITKNTGHTAAKHYQLRYELLFDGKDTNVIESINDVTKKWRTQVPLNKKVLVPQDIDTFPYWRKQGDSQIPWMSNEIMGEIVVPIFLASVFYRIEGSEHVVREITRAWIVGSYHEDGTAADLIRKDGGSLTSEQLRVSPFTTSMLADEWSLAQE